MNRLSRRQFTRMAATGAGAHVLGFDVTARSWTTRAQAQGPTLAGVPKLDGELLVDESSRKAIAVDWGNLFHRVPAAVLKPRSVDDVVKIVRYANDHALKIAIKGQGHSRYGQTQAEAGIVIDTSTLATVQAPTEDGVDAGPGASWGAVAEATLAKGLTPRVIPDCLLLTIGGVLSAGGIGNTSQHFGVAADNVTELDVVTGDGRLVTCSAERERELFEMVLGGQGQCAVIVRARIRLMPAPSHVVLHELSYGDLERYIADHTRIASLGRFDHQGSGGIRKVDGQWKFVMQIGAFFTPPHDPNLASLETGLRPDATAPPKRVTYREYLDRRAAEIAQGLSSGAFKRPSPVITALIPASATKQFAADLIVSPSHLAGIGRYSFYALNTRRFTRPLFKAPAEEHAFVFWLFRSAPIGDQATLTTILESNRALLAKMTAVGGKRYAPYSMVLSPAEWEGHFGADVWRRLAAAKKRYDPNGVLSPQPAMLAGGSERRQ